MLIAFTAGQEVTLVEEFVLAPRRVGLMRLMFLTAQALPYKPWPVVEKLMLGYREVLESVEPG